MAFDKNKGKSQQQQKGGFNKNKPQNNNQQQQQQNQNKGEADNSKLPRINLIKRGAKVCQVQIEIGDGYELSYLAFIRDSSTGDEQFLSIPSRYDEKNQRWRNIFSLSRDVTEKINEMWNNGEVQEGKKEDMPF